MERDTHCLFDDACGLDPGGQRYRSLGRNLTLIKMVKARQETAQIQRKTTFRRVKNLWLFLVAWKAQIMPGQVLSLVYRSNMV